MIDIINSIISNTIDLFSTISIAGITYTFAIAWFFVIIYFLGKLKK